MFIKKNTVMRVSVYVLSAKWDMSFPKQCDLSVAGKVYGHELFSGRQEAILDFCRDQSCNHFTLLVQENVLISVVNSRPGLLL